LLPPKKDRRSSQAAKEGGNGWSAVVRLPKGDGEKTAVVYQAVGRKRHVLQQNRGGMGLERADSNNNKREKEERSLALVTPRRGEVGRESKKIPRAASDKERINRQYHHRRTEGRRKGDVIPDRPMSAKKRGFTEKVALSAPVRKGGGGVTQVSGSEMQKSPKEGKKGVKKFMITDPTKKRKKVKCRPHLYDRKGKKKTVLVGPYQTGEGEEKEKDSDPSCSAPHEEEKKKKKRGKGYVRSSRNQ